MLAAMSSAAVPCGGAEKADWPSFRGSPSMSGVAPTPLPEKPQLLWKHEAGSAIASSAAIVGDRVYVGTQKGEVLCVRLEDGERV